MPEAFTFFWKHRLSQWHRAPFVLGGVTFTHAEQSMMYAKALLFGDRAPEKQRHLRPDSHDLFGDTLCGTIQT